MRREDVDLASRWWTVPAEFAKNKKAHRVPLSQAAVEILTATMKGSSGQWVFPALRDPLKAFDYQTIHKTIRGLRKADDPDCWSSHDLRRTVVTSLASAGVSRETTMKILNHTEPGAISIYDRHGYDAQKQAALDMWGKKLQAILDDAAAADNVVPFAATGR